MSSVYAIHVELVVDVIVFLFFFKSVSLWSCSIRQRYGSKRHCLGGEGGAGLVLLSWHCPPLLQGRMPMFPQGPRGYCPDQWRIPPLQRCRWEGEVPDNICFLWSVSHSYVYRWLLTWVIDQIPTLLLPLTPFLLVLICLSMVKTTFQSGEKNCCFYNCFYDSSFDCFHPSRLAHNTLTTVLWKNSELGWKIIVLSDFLSIIPAVFVPLSQKDRSYNSFEFPAFCPGPNDFLQ